MRVWTTVCLTIAVALAVGVASATAAGGGNSANAKLCQKNGWQTSAMSNGGGFANQDACVSYAAKGGTFGAPGPDLKVYLVSCALTGNDVACSFRVENVGPGTVTGEVRVRARFSYTTTSTDEQVPSAAAAGCDFASASGDGHPPDISSEAAAGCPVTGAGVTVFNDLIIAVGQNDIPAGVTVTVTAQADPDNTIVEFNETNNTYTQTFTVPTPP